MAEEKRASETQTIDYFRMYKNLEGLCRTVSVQLEEARKALERSCLDREDLQKRIKAQEAKIKELQEFAVDEVTNLASTALRDRQLEAYMEQYKRQLYGRDEKALLSENRLIVLSIDLDQFSAINDRHGQTFGDHILRFVGQVITSRIRKCDIASRKGQRFLIVFVDCTARGAIMKAREIVQRVAKENFGESTGEQIQVTATVGVALYDGKIDRPEFLRRAECAMKFGKDSGRYCTVLYKEGGGGAHEVVERFVRNGKPRIPSLL